MQNLVGYFQQNDQFANHVGIKLLSAEKGKAKAMMKVEKRHLNSAHVLHGGALFTLADFVFAAASNSYGNIALSINANINFIKAVHGGAIYAEAEEISRSRKIATYSIKITDEVNEVVATMQGTVYRKSEPLPDL